MWRAAPFHDCFDVDNDILVSTDATRGRDPENVGALSVFYVILLLFRMRHPIPHVALRLSPFAQPLVEKLPKLKVVMEHITTSEAVAFVTAAPANVAATITPQHLLYNRNAIFQVRSF